VYAGGGAGSRRREKGDKEKPRLVRGGAEG
jgi:hypothetical protein